MSKTLKMSILLIVITLGILFLSQNCVSAADIDSVDTLKEVFKGKAATIDGTTITLTGDVEFIITNETEEAEGPKYDIVNLMNEDYVLNLNGHDLIAGEFYVCDGSSLVLNDTTGKGAIKNYARIEKGAKAVINNGTFSSLLDNSGELTVNNGTIHSLWNFGTLTINDGNFANISSDEGKAYIKGGKFTAYKFSEKLEDGTIGEMDYFSMFNVKSSSIVITGGVFKADGIDEALRIHGNNEFDVNENSINDLIGKGYVAKYDIKQSTNWEVSYSYVEIVKDETDAILNKIAPNGVWTITGTKPKNMEEAEFLLSAIAGDEEVPKGYELMAWVEPADKFDPEVVEIHVYYNGSLLKSKTVKAVYNEPSKEVKTKVGSVLDKIAKQTGENHDVETGFRLEDLYLINYLNASTEGFDSSLALNFSKDLIALTNGANMSYKFDSRLGDSTPTGLWNYTGGEVIVYHDGVAVGTTRIGLTLNNVLYVSSDTANSDEARIAAALKRIEDYLGTTKGISIKVGGTLESLNEDGETWNKHGFIDEKTCGSNYYNVTVNGETYKFAICKKEESKLEAPKYIGSNLGSNITITSDDKTIPLDTSIKVDEVKEVKKNIIKKALGTSTYVAYDISLYSKSTQKNITKLENGKFKVGIPVPEEFKGKDDITVYFIDDDGKKDDMEATVKDGIVSFETNHFSTYVIAEKVKETPKQENKGDKDVSPDTGNRDIIGYVFAVTVISTLGIVELKRKK